MVVREAHACAWCTTPTTRPKFCSPKCHQTAKDEAKKVPCANGCGRMIWRDGHGSTKPGVSTCNPCRRAQRCTEPKCDKRAVDQTLCERHLRRAARPKPQVRTCRTCPAQLTGPSQAIYCSTRCRKLQLSWRTVSRRWAKEHLAPEGPSMCVYYGDCAVCEQPFVTRHRSQRTCSSTCRGRLTLGRRYCPDCGAPLAVAAWQRRCSSCLRAHRRTQRKTQRKSGNTHRRRAHHHGAPYETIDKPAIYERDGWRCGICRRRVQRHLMWPHWDCAVLDHIVPLSVPGTPGHVPANVQCAHNRCNHAKSNSLGQGVQPALF